MQQPENSGLTEYQRLLTLLDQRRIEEAQVRGRILLEEQELGTLTRAKLHNLLCWTFVEGLKRPSPEAVLHGEEAVRLATSAGDRALMVQALFNLASARYQAGDYAPARSAYQELRAILTAEPDLIPSGQVLALLGLAQADATEGRTEAALSLLDEAETLARNEESGTMLAEIARRRALLLLRLNQAEQAGQVLRAIDEERLASGPRGLWWRTHLRFSMARVELARGHWSTARAQAVNTMALARELGDLPVLAECTCLLTLAEAAEGKREAYRRARTALTYAISSGRRDVVDDVRERLKDLLAIGI